MTKDTSGGFHPSQSGPDVSMTQIGHVTHLGHNLDGFATVAYRSRSFWNVVISSRSNPRSSVSKFPAEHKKTLHCFSK